MRWPCLVPLTTGRATPRVDAIRIRDSAVRSVRSPEELGDVPGDFAQGVPGVPGRLHRADQALNGVLAGSVDVPAGKKTPGLAGDQEHHVFDRVRLIL